MIRDLSEASWRKSSKSGGEGTECVELHPTGAVRDSKNPSGLVLVFGRWAAVASLLKSIR